MPKNYQWNASDYAQHSSAQFQWALELIEKLNLQGSESVLDIGCGDGKVTAEIADRLPLGRVVGIDSSEEMIRLASEKIAAAPFNNITFMQMDAREMIFKQEFDVIFSNATLHWIKDHLDVLKKMYSALHPGGKILLQMGGKGNAASIIAVADALISREPWKAYFTDFTFPYGFYDETRYKDWLIKVGFKPARIELIAKDMTHNGSEKLRGWFRTTWLPYTERVPEEKQEKFISEVIDAYLLANPPDKIGRTHVEMVRLEVEAEK